VSNTGLKKAYRVDWMEFEEGWGAKPDGSTLYKTLDDAVKGIEKYRRDQRRFSKPAPCGSYPATQPLEALVPQKLYNKLIWGRKGPYGLHVFEDDPLYAKIKLVNHSW
jgi:hypothetical protein